MSNSNTLMSSETITAAPDAAARAAPLRRPDAADHPPPRTARRRPRAAGRGTPGSSGRPQPRAINPACRGKLPLDTDRPDRYTYGLNTVVSPDAGRPGKDSNGGTIQ